MRYDTMLRRQDGAILEIAATVQFWLTLLPSREVTCVLLNVAADAVDDMKVPGLDLTKAIRT